MSKWDILCLTQPSRERFLRRLSAVLRPQLADYSEVQFISRIFDRSLDLGTNRQRMLEASSAEWTSFIDDDDLVPANYVSTIFPLLNDVDYIGFRLQYYHDGVKQKPTFHSLRYPEWNADQDGFYRDLSHVNPIRRALALQVPMSGGAGEDHRWADALRKKNIVRTEHFIDSVMYFYFFRSHKEDLPSAPSAQIRLEGIGFTGQTQTHCPKCGSSSCSLAGGMMNCNQCNARWSQ